MDRATSLAWLQNSAALAPIGIMTAMAAVPLGPSTNPAIAAALIIAAALGLTLALTGHPDPRARKTARTILAATLTAIPLGLLAFLPAFLPASTGDEPARQSPAQQNHSQGVILLNRTRLAAPDHQVNRTIQEMEKGRITAETQWPPAQGAPPIFLQLYPNLTQYQEGAGLPGAGGHTICLPQGPLVVIPLEPYPRLIPNWGRRTPLHEMTHAALCRQLGPAKYAELPAWFHEGLATSLEFQGAARTPLRATRRLSAWLTPGNSPTPQAFCTPNPGLGHRSSRSFYTMAHEFTQHLREKHGPNVMQTIAQDVAANITFRESIRNRTGQSCQQLYQQWLESWQIGWLKNPGEREE